MLLKTPFCNDQIEIATSQIKSEEVVACNCGIRYRIVDLVDFQRLTDRQEKLQQEIADLVQSMIARRRELMDEPVVGRAAAASKAATYPTAISQPTRQPVTQPAPVKAFQPPVRPEPRPVRATRARVTLSTQQWLIIGASLLVFVAASVFVGNYRDNITSEGFLAITLGVSAATGFAGFKSRKLSVLLSNFTAAFSSAMLMMALLIIGDIFNPFTWDAAPASWWAITLFVVSISSAALAKFSSNFGWKAISPLSFTFAGLAFTYGTVGTWIAEIDNAYPWSLLSLSITAIALLYLIRFIKSIPHPKVDDEANRAYEQDLERREVTALAKYAQFATILLGVFSLGVLVSQTWNILNNPIDPISSLALSAVWFIGASTIDRWGAPLSSTGAVSAQLRLVAWLLGTVNLALGLNALAIQAGNVWLSTWLSLIGLGVILAMPAVKRFLDIDRLAQTVALWVSVGSYLLWNILFGWANTLFANEENPDPLTRAGAYLVGFSILLVLSELLAEKTRPAILATSVNLTGTLLLVLGLKSDASINTWSLVSWITLLAASIAVFNWVQRWVAQRSGSEVSSATAIIAAAQLALSGVILVTFNPASTTQEILVPLSLILLVEAALLRIASSRLAIVTKLGFKEFASLQSYVLQGITLVLALSALGADSFENNSPKLLLVAVAASAFNYLFGALEKVKNLFIVGFVLANLSLLVGWSAIWVVLDQIGLTASSGATFALITLVSLGFVVAHRALVGKFAELSSTEKLTIGLAGPFGVLLATFVFQASTLATMSSVDYWILQLTFVALSLAGSAITLLRKASSSESTSRLVTFAALGYAIASFLPITNLSLFEDPQDSHWRILLAAASFSAVAIAANRRTPAYAWLAGSFVGLILVASQIASLVHLTWKTDVPEIDSVLLALAISTGTLLSGKQFGRFKKHFVLDAPVALAALYSLQYALAGDPATDETQLRLVASLVILAGLAHWRTVTEKLPAWLAGASLLGVFASIQLAVAIRHFAQINSDTPELFGVLIALSVVIAALVSGDLLGNFGKFARLDAPVLVASLTSLGYAVANNPAEGSNLLRALVALAVIAGLSAWRTNQYSNWVWLAATYAASIGFALALGREAVVTLRLGSDFPEAYSVTLTAALLAVNLLLRKVQEQNTTLFTWGLPAATLILPSAFATAATIDLSFDALTTTQLVRTIAVLIAGIVVFVLGVRGGNLGLTVVGLAALSLVAWVRVQGTETTAFELRSLIVAFVAFVVLWLIKKSTEVQGNSIVFIGIPVAIALTPPLFNALAALGNPELQTVDWWRFAIVLIASLTLLIVGSLRETAGMFFPGLIGVLVTVLPYGLQRVSNESWFLWVVLLFVAGIMVWIAVRLEQMRKVGKSSVAWIKSLK